MGRHEKPARKRWRTWWAAIADRKAASDERPDTAQEAEENTAESRDAGASSVLQSVRISDYYAMVPLQTL